MRVLVDAMGAPANSGGMNLYARELLAAWTETFPDDELIVVGGEWVAEHLGDYPSVVPVVKRGRSIVSRSWTQLVGSGIMFRRRGSEALLSLSPIVSPLAPRAHRAAVVHDWRHLRRPAEFGRGQRLYRSLWKWSVRNAGTAIVISDKTAAETVEFASPRCVVVVENGGDHPRRWTPAAREGGVPIVLTYGHFVNKRPEPVIEAIALLRVRGIDARLCVLGAKGEYREKLRALAVRQGVEDAVDLPGYVPEDDYRDLVQRASVLVLNSSDEGFGLPVSEARYFGIPAVVAADSGLDGIHGDSVLVADPVAESLATSIEEALNGGSSKVTAAQTWAACAAGVRAALRANR